MTVAPVIGFELNFSGLKDEMLAIRDFFDAQCGKAKLFYYIDIEGVQHICRFNNTSIVIVEKYAWENGVYDIVAYTTSVQLRKEG